MFKRLICIFISIILLTPFNAYADDLYISGEHAIVIDAYSRNIIYEKNAYTEHSMASTTKIMTCIIACETSQLDEVVTITSEMLDGAIGTLIYLNVGDKISLLDLVKGALLSSGNDAANAIAVHIAGKLDDFIKMMNEKAEKIGMTNTVFCTPSGLDKNNHHSTAYDMAILAAYSLDNKVFSSICSLKSTEITINDKKQTIYNHNKLLSYDENFVGIKTGFTEKSGRCLVTAYKYENNYIIVVTLNAPNDWDDHKKLVKYAKKQYTVYNSKTDYVIPVVGAYDKSVDCTAEYNITTMCSLTFKAYYYPFIYAPVKTGDIVGKLIISSDNRELMTVDIIVRKDISIWQITK